MCNVSADNFPDKTVFYFRITRHKYSMFKLTLVSLTFGICIIICGTEACRQQFMYFTSTFVVVITCRLSYSDFAYQSDYSLT